jgi:rubrerythrin
MGEKDQLFDGQPVIEFQSAKDRRQFLKYAGMVGVGGTLALTGVACAEDEPTPSGDNSQSDDEPSEDPSKEPSVPQGDLDILNYALTLEFLEADFYEQGVDSGVVKGRELDLIKPIAEHEAAHVASLTSTISELGGEPVAKPNFKYPAPTFKDKAAFLKTASTFEELGVKAYHGQVTMIKTPEILGAAASIAGVESRHAAVLAKLVGGNPFPAPVEGMLSMDEVLKAATPFIKS